MIFDLHIHSRFSSDSLLEPARIVELAKKIGLNGVAVADHNTIEGGIKTAEYAPGDFAVIVGEEINTEVGDILGLFLTKQISSGSFEEVVKEIHNQAGIALLAHPYKRNKIISQDALKRLDAIEVFNSRNAKNNAKAENTAREYKLPMVAGSDAHFAFEIGRAKTIIDSPPDIESIKRAILSGKTKIIGENSPVYIDFLSQAIKYFKIWNR